MEKIEVMKITGHTQWSTFERYVNIDQISAREIAEKLDEKKNQKTLRSGESSGKSDPIFIH